MNKITSVSIILPAYNEGQNIYKSIEASYNAIKKYTSDFEIIVVNDGSKDNTLEEAARAAKQFNNIIIENQENQGYGGAIKKGFSLSKKDWIFFTDSDLQFDIEQISDLVEFSDKFDFIFGYRKKRVEGFKRAFIAFLLKIWNKIFLNFPLYIKDIDCAFKLLKREEFLKTFPLISSGAMINTEFILKIHLLGYKIKQIPVNHYPRVNGNPTGSNIGVIKKAIRETFSLRQNIAEFYKKR